PALRPNSRTTFSFRSVAIPEACLGQAIQRAVLVESDFANGRKSRTRSACEVAKSTATFAPSASVTISAPSGSGSSFLSKRTGALRSTTQQFSRMPSFFGKGVPEYPAVATPWDAWRDGRPRPSCSPEASLLFCTASSCFARPDSRGRLYPRGFDRGLADLNLSPFSRTAASQQPAA